VLTFISLYDVQLLVWVVLDYQLILIKADENVVFKVFIDSVYYKRIVRSFRMSITLNRMIFGNNMLNTDMTYKTVDLSTSFLCILYSKQDIAVI
jgi:hypothetical protein